MSKNKRGFLLAEETLKIVIALICIGFLAYFLIALYFSHKDGQNLEFAKASLEHLVQEINSNSPTVEIYNPKNWVVVTWPSDIVTGTDAWIKKDVKEKSMPDSCTNMDWKTCVCICKDRKAEDCDKKGICLDNKKNLIIQEEWDSVEAANDNANIGGVSGFKNSIKIEKPPIKLKIDYVLGTISK